LKKKLEKNALQKADASKYAIVAAAYTDLTFFYSGILPKSFFRWHFLIHEGWL
jgi:hypothetical protein